MKDMLSKSLMGITPASIEKYMLLTGWRRDLSFANPKIMVFQHKMDGALRIAVPAVEGIREYMISSFF